MLQATIETSNLSTRRDEAGASISLAQARRGFKRE
jgi:hypothetical protein